MRNALRRAEEDAKRATVSAEAQVTARRNPPDREPPQLFYPQPPRPAPPPQQQQRSRSVLLYLIAGLVVLTLVGVFVFFKLRSERVGGDVSTAPAAENASGQKEHTTSIPTPQPMPQSTPQSTPQTSPQAKSIDISGNWSGDATGGDGASLVWTMTLTQKEGQVAGRIRMASADQQYCAVIIVEGSITGHSFAFAGTRFIESMSGPDLIWCLPAGILQYTESDGVPTLEGTWGGNNVEDGCPEGVRGHIKVSK